MFRVSVEKLHSALKYNVEFPFGQILEMIAFKLKIAPTPYPMSFQWNLRVLFGRTVPFSRKKTDRKMIFLFRQSLFTWIHYVQYA